MSKKISQGSTQGPEKKSVVVDNSSSDRVDKVTDKNTKAIKTIAQKNSNTDVKASKTLDKSAAAKKEKPSKHQSTETPPLKQRSYIAALAIVIALSGAGLAAYDFWLVKDQKSINEQITKNQNDFQKDIQALQQQLLAANSALSNETRARESAQAEHQALSIAMQNISAKLGRSTVAWRMAEVEYLLTVANHRLTLAQDSETAIAIFETADQRIKAIGDTALLKVRKQISDELTALRALPAVDISGLALRVGSLVDGVEQLPLMDKKRIAVVLQKDSERKLTDWQALPMAVWTDIKSLVQVRRQQQPTEPLLPPEQAWYLLQNLKLKLEQARLAVLRRDTDLFQQHLTEATRWIEHYFERESSAVQAAQSSITVMSKIELQSPFPDVSASLRLLREVMNERQSDVVANADKKETSTP